MTKMLQAKMIKPLQLEVIRRIVLGQESLEIAKALGISPSNVKTITDKPEAKEYLTLYLELLNLISGLAQNNQTLEALQAQQNLLAQRADIKELIEFARNLMDLTGKQEFGESISRLKHAAQKFIDRQAA